MRLALGVSVIVLVVGGCSPGGGQDRRASDAEQTATEASGAAVPVEDMRRAAPTPSQASQASQTPPGTMPEAVRGQWRENDLGRDPTREDCNQTSQSNRNFGKVLTITAEGYSLFEEGGRIIAVHSRSDESIDATFDTTYADTPTRARRSVALQSKGALAVTDDYGGGRVDLTEYLPCP